MSVTPIFNVKVGLPVDDLDVNFEVVKEKTLYNQETGEPYQHKEYADVYKVKGVKYYCLEEMCEDLGLNYFHGVDGEISSVGIDIHNEYDWYTYSEFLKEDFDNFTFLFDKFKEKTGLEAKFLIESGSC